jgi:hypothetical protein
MFFELVNKSMIELFCDKQDDTFCLDTGTRPTWDFPTNGIQLINQFNKLGPNLIAFGHDYNDAYFKLLGQFHPNNSKYSKDTLFVLLVLHATTHLTKHLGTYSPIDLAVDLLILDMDYQDVDSILRAEGMEFLILFLQSTQYEMARLYPEHLKLIRYVIIKTLNPDYLPQYYDTELSFTTLLVSEVNLPNVQTAHYSEGKIPLSFSFRSDWLRFKNYLASNRFDSGFQALFHEHDMQMYRNRNPGYFD